MKLLRWKRFIHPYFEKQLWYRCGDVSVHISRDNELWHMSISVPYRYPSWDEMRAAWYTLIPDAGNITGAMFFPKKSEYVNVHQNCFHIHEVPESEIPHNAKIFSQVL